MEPLIHESFIALQHQVDALARGTNPVVYFPVGTKKVPDMPANADATVVEGDVIGAGAYFYNPKFVREEEIHNAVRTGTLGYLLGFVQTKEQAMRGVPTVIIARDKDGNEIKTALVDAKNLRAVFLQKRALELQFPDASVMMEPAQNVLVERLVGAADGHAS
jgi:hypothetical protein